jgi:hypothetical protein
MGKKYIFIAVFISFSIISVAQIPIKKYFPSIFRLDSLLHKEMSDSGFSYEFNRWVQVADMNNDGKLDFVTQPYMNNKRRDWVLSVFFNNSNDSVPKFINKKKYSVYTLGDPAQFTVGDVNNDGKIDILEPTENYHGTAENKSTYLYPNGGDHTPDKLFLQNDTGFKTISFPDNFNTLAGNLYDLDGDGKLKIIIANYSLPKDIDQNIKVPAINTDLFPDLNWNDHAQSKNAPYDFNNDGIPDILTYRRISNTSVLPPIFEIKDYTGKSIFTFNIKEINPQIRDSLNNLIYDYRDINGDGYLDLALTYMGEWWFGQPGAQGSISKFYGANTYLLISKGNLQYDVTEIINNLDNQAQFNVNLFDWDFDGKVDVLPNSMSEGSYFKNMGNNTFEKKSISPLFSQMIGNKLDYDKDGKLDFVNLYVRQKDENGNYNTNNSAQTLTVVTAKEVLNFLVTGKVIDKSIYISANVRSSERISMIDGDGDGDMDLVVGGVLIENNRWSYFQEYFENTGAKFEYRDNYIEIDKSLIGELQAWTYDIDKDGDMDLFYPTYSKSKLKSPKSEYFWWENTKTGFKINRKFNLNFQDSSLLYQYDLEKNTTLTRNTFFQGPKNSDKYLIRIGQIRSSNPNYNYFPLSINGNNKVDTIRILAFKKGTNISLFEKCDTIANIPISSITKKGYTYYYTPVNDWGMFVSDLNKDGKFEVITQEFVNGYNGPYNIDTMPSSSRIQVYDKSGNISNNFLDSTLQYDPQMISHANGISLTDINGDGFEDILPFGGWGWWSWQHPETAKIDFERLNKRLLLNNGSRFKSFNIDLKGQTTDFINQQIGYAYYYPMKIDGSKEKAILIVKGLQSSGINNSLDAVPALKLDFSQFQFPCDVNKPVINIHGLTSIPYNDSKTKIFVDTIDGIKTIWYKSNIIIGNTNSITINEIGDYKIVRTNLGGCVNEKLFTVEKEGQVALRLKTFSISVNDSNANRINNMGVGGPLEYSVSGSILYSIGGIEHIIGTPALGEGGLPPIHLINKSGNWQLENIYPEAAMGNARNYVFVDSTTIAYADHGLESGNPWPYGDIWTVKNSNDKLKWTKISKYKSFYHSVAVGDLDLDGKYDLMGLHMGSYDPWKGIGGLHPYIQQNDSTFIDGVNTMILPTSLGFVAGPGAVAIKDILGDKHPEIIVTQYGSSGDAYGYLIYAYSSISKAYEFYKKANNLGVFSEAKQDGANSTSIKLADFDRDGIDDMAIATEGYPNGKIQIWLGKKDGIFEPDQILNYSDTSKGSYPDSSNAFREFEVSDVDKDGWLDIIVHPSNFGTQFRINPGPNGPHYTDNGWRGYGIKLQASIWRNTKGTFNYLTNDLSIPGIYPGYAKGFFVNNKLKFFGFQNTGSYSAQATLSEKHKFNLYEMTVTFCKNLIKPTFNTTKYSFCSGDSLKLTVSNINKGDSLKWYYGTKNDLTNVSNKTFTDSTKLFVTRIDSVGCVISSDTIQIKKYGIPSAPTLSRDTANFLLSGAAGTTWYKDGSAITDTAQKYKPTAAGSYTAKTTTNGCTSVMSSAYYYLVTDIINLSKDEFIKLAPNPFINQLNFDFIVKGYQKLNIEVYDVATGSKVANQQNITAGTKIQLGQLARGTYIVRVTSNDNKIAQQFKMVKL